MGGGWEAKSDRKSSLVTVTVKYKSEVKKEKDVVQRSGGEQRKGDNLEDKCLSVTCLQNTTLTRAKRRLCSAPVEVGY